MTALEIIEELTSRAVVYTVAIECEAAMGGKSWVVILSDNHARKGHGQAPTLEIAAYKAIVDLNHECGGQLRRYL